MNQIQRVYRALLAFHGPQGWWPIINPRTFLSEYHVHAPRGKDDFFEISIGAILTQNIAWKNVDSALGALKRKGLLDPESLRKIRTEHLAMLIRPTGYYNQKAKKIKHFLTWYGSRGWNYPHIKKLDAMLLRDELLAVHGIGPETADSILLYALDRPVFVVDAYTRRVFTRIGAISGDESYTGIQELFHKSIKRSTRVYNEYHALIVAHGKDYCTKNPACGECCISKICEKRLS